MRICIFGGSFDPPHAGHLKLARHLIEALSLDVLLIIPAACSPFKSGTHAADFQRLDMCRLVFADEKMEVLPFEIEKGGTSYTIDTVTHIRALYPDAKIYLAMGADQFLCFVDWRQWKDIMRLATPVAVCRSSQNMLGALEAYADRELRAHGEAVVLPFDPLEVSSTSIRRRITMGKSIDGLLPEVLLPYIEKYRVYTKDGNYVRAVHEKLSEYRFRHSMAVAETAEKLAEKYGADPAAAYTAGVLHDILKEQPPAEALAFFEDRGVTLTPLERGAPKLWHAMAGAIYVREAFDVSVEIAEAIRWHTTGKAHMTTLEKILFVADFISEDREYPGVEDMRRRAQTSLELAMDEGLRFTIEELKSRGAPVHPDSLACYEEIQKELQKETDRKEIPENE